MRRGDHGTLVCLLQRLLDVTSSSENPEHAVLVDGDYGYETEAAVKLHQLDVNARLKGAGFDLDVDGVCGPMTWASLWQPWIWSLGHIGTEVKS